MVNNSRPNSTTNVCVVVVHESLLRSHRMVNIVNRSPTHIQPHSLTHWHHHLFTDPPTQSRTRTRSNLDGVAVVCKRLNQHNSDCHWISFSRSPYSTATPIGTYSISWWIRQIEYESHHEMSDGRKRINWISKYKIRQTTVSVEQSTEHTETLALSFRIHFLAEQYDSMHKARRLREHQAVLDLNEWTRRKR